MPITISPITHECSSESFHYRVEFNFDGSKIDTCVTSLPIVCDTFFVHPIRDIMSHYFGVGWGRISPPPVLPFQVNPADFITPAISRSYFTEFFTMRNCIYVGEGIIAKRQRLIAKGWGRIQDWRLTDWCDLTRLAIETAPRIIVPFIRQMALTGFKPTCYASHLARLYLGLEVPPNDVMDEAGFGEELLEMPLVKYACVRSYIYFKLGMRFVNPIDISQKAEAYNLRRSYGQGGGQPVGAFVAVFCVGVSLEIWCLFSFS